MPSTPLRVGIVGVGWGSVVQTPAFRLVPEFEVVALCSRRAESVQAAGQKLEISDVSTDWEAFVQRPDLDVISIATPVDLHLSQTLAAIAAGKHVLVEKPVGLTSSETGQMLNAAQAAGVCHAVCFESRWEPSRLAVWEHVAAGNLGKPFLAAARSGADFWHPTRAMQSEWMYSTAAGGGYLMGMGSHDLDFLCALFGEPVEVCADVRTSVPQRTRSDGSTFDVDADDTSVVMIRFASGLVASVITTAIAYGQNFRSFEAFGADGSIAYNGALMAETEPLVTANHVGTDGSVEIGPIRRMPRSGGEPPKRRAAGAIKALALMLEEWLPAFEGKPTTAPTLVDGHRVAMIIDAARRSATGEGWVRL